MEIIYTFDQKNYNMDTLFLQPPSTPRIRSEMDTLIFTLDSVKGTKVDEPVTSKKDISPSQLSTNKDITKSITKNEMEGDVEVKNIGRSLDLYKVTPNF